MDIYIDPMRKPSIKVLSLVFIALAFSAISWISVKKSHSTVLKTKAAVTAKTVSSADLFDRYVEGIYQKAGLAESKLDFQVFKKAVIGYYNFKKAALVSSSKSVITIVDFNQPSTAKRLWIVDLAANKLLYNTLVAHGQGSGDNFARNFSNEENSHQSSLGYYITSDIYFGKHGLSLKLNGMDEGFNTKANARSVVVHGAAYVSQEFINQHGRLGRSHGCPALPVSMTREIIENIKGKTCLYINADQKNYTSKYYNAEEAIADYIAGSGSVQASI